MPKANRASPSYREHRPIDILMKPESPIKKSTYGNLPDAWKSFLDQADTWPYVDPDENGLADPEPLFSDYPADPADLPTGIEPFSEDEPWGKMISESDREYELFCHYRAQGITRTYQKTAEHFEVGRHYINQRAAERNWPERARAWDDYREKIYTTELILGVKEMAHRHSEIAQEGIEALSLAFSVITNDLADEDTRDALLEELQSLPAKAKLALAQNSARVIQTLMNAERVSRGLPTEITADLHLHEARITVQSTDDLAQIISGLSRSLPEPNIIDAEVVDDESGGDGSSSEGADSAA